MNSKKWMVPFLVLMLAIPLLAGNKNGNNKLKDRGLIEKMEAVPCGASQKGLSGLGALWASAGITHMSTTEKLCPQYLLRTDQMDYEIRPKDLKHATILPVGQEGVFEIRKNELLLRFPDSDDHRTRAYQIVQMDPTDTGSGSNSDQATSSSLNPDERTNSSSGEPYATGR
jgi:hypothetical protein